LRSPEPVTIETPLAAQQGERNQHDAGRRDNRRAAPASWDAFPYNARGHRDVLGRRRRELLRISGLMREDNDLVVIENAAAAAAFKHNFEARFVSGETLSLAGPSSQP
jgi:hypothetical protein